MRRYVLHFLLDLALKEAASDRDDINTRGNFTVDQKRAVAHIYTKLKEAEMWMEEARGYYDSR